jgi:hypothetical protein
MHPTSLLLTFISVVALLSPVFGDNMRKLDANPGETLQMVDQNKPITAACCDDSCRIAICAPFTVVCLLCGNKDMEKSQVLSSSTSNNNKPVVNSVIDHDRTDCCDDKCRTAICVPPWVSICLGCDEHNQAQTTTTTSTSSTITPQQSSPIKQHMGCCEHQCSDRKCYVEVCVFWFIQICI